MNRIGEPIAKCIISTLISVTLFSCHMDKESAITLFEQGKKMEKRMLPDSAVIMYQRAIKQSATQKDIELTGIIYNQLGDLYLSHYLFNKSLSAYKLGLKYTQLSSDKTNKSKSLRGIGKSYTYNSKPDSGLIYLSQALLLSKSINDKEEVVRIHNNISNAYFELKQFKEALVQASILIVSQELILCIKCRNMILHSIIIPLEPSVITLTPEPVAIICSINFQAY